MEEQAEIENAWNAIRTGEQVQKVSGYLGLLPGLLERTTSTALRKWTLQPDHAREAPSRKS
jgi:hypothetical protein